MGKVQVEEVYEAVTMIRSSNTENSEKDGGYKHVLLDGSGATQELYIQNRYCRDHILTGQPYFGTRN